MSSASELVHLEKRWPSGASPPALQPEEPLAHGLGTPGPRSTEEASGQALLLPRQGSG